MAQIQDGVASTLLGVDATSNALRATLYDSSGNELNKPSTGSYMIALNMGRMTAATAANNYVWAMRNAAAAARTIYLRRIRLTAAFDGTAAATTSLIDVVRYDTADFTGGTAISLPAGAVKKRTSYANSILGDARFAVAGLTLGSVVVGSAFASFSVPRGATGGVVPMELAFHQPNENFSNFELAAGEGIAFKLNVAAVIGDSFSGFIEWDER